MRKETPFRLENVGEHFPVKCRRFLANPPDVPKAQVPIKLTKTTFKCEVCDVYLCISRENNCFQLWHTQTENWRTAASLDEDEGH